MELIDKVKEDEKYISFNNIETSLIVEISKEIVLKLQAKKARAYILTVINDTIVYSELLPGATVDNYMWAKRKGNTAMLLAKSSYLATLEFQERKKDLSNRGLQVADYALSGGAVPIIIGDLVVGFIAVSGMTQEEDHQVIVDVLKEYRIKGLLW